MTTFTVPGKPMAKQRARGGRFGHYTPKETVNAEAVIRMTAAQHFPAPIAGPVALEVVAVFAPPASWSRRKTAAAMGGAHTQRPDIDNIAKLASDALNGVAFADDGQVADLRCAKRWGEASATIITVRALIAPP